MAWASAGNVVLLYQHPGDAVAHQLGDR
jgi:hypothetical protein